MSPNYLNKKDTDIAVQIKRLHLIPRRKGDVENARGGVRGVISSKQKY